MRTRWILAASILVVMALLPGALRATEASGFASTAAVAAVAIPAPNLPGPAATTLPIWAAPATPSPQASEVLQGEPIWLASCSSCTPLPRCSSVHSCVLMGCC
jgi:hypothetical protein